MNTQESVEIVIQPRNSMDWEEFVRTTPEGSIALDGIVTGGPKYDEITKHINFDHHDGVVREATMSTATQVFMAIKGGLMKSFGKCKPCLVYINDTDQDTALAVWLLLKHELFEGTRSIPHINRLLSLDNHWDITGGAFPVNLNDELVRQHTWVFRPYADLRKSGKLAQASQETMRDNLEAVLGRLNQFLMGQSGSVELDTRREILFQSPEFWIVNELGGNEARYQLFSEGMDAFISKVATREDGHFVYTIGRRSRFIPFPVKKFYDIFNKAENLPTGQGWGGSDIIGGSSRSLGSSLSWEELRDLTIKQISSE